MKIVICEARHRHNQRLHSCVLLCGHSGPHECLCGDQWRCAEEPT